MRGFSVFTDFRVGKDEVLGALKKQKQQTEATYRSMLSSAKGFAKSAVSIRSVFGGVLAAGAVQHGISAVISGVRSATEEVLSFDDAITGAGARFGFARGTEGFRKLTEAARETGATTRYTATEAAGALEFFSKAGIGAEQAMASLPLVAQFASASSLDLARASDIATDALGAYGLLVDSTTGKMFSADEIQKNLTKTMDIMSYAVNTANMDMEDFFDVMKRSAPTVKAMGGGIETFAAMVQTMAGQGIKGRLASVPMRNLFLRLVDQVDGAQGALKKIGVTVEDVTGKLTGTKGGLRSFLPTDTDVGILADLQKGLSKLTKVQAEKTLGDIFGAEGAAGVQAIMKASLEGITQAKNNIETISEGYTEMLSGLKEMSLMNRLLKVRSALMEKALQIFDKYEAKIPSFLDKLTEGIMSFDVKPITEALDKLWRFTSGIMSFLREHYSTLKKIAYVWLGISATVKAISLVTLVRDAVKLASSISKSAAGMAALSKANAPLSVGAKGGGAGIGDKIGGATGSFGLGYLLGDLFSSYVLEPMANDWNGFMLQAENDYMRAKGIISSKNLSVEKVYEDLNKQYEGFHNTATSSGNFEELFGEIGSWFTGEESPSERRGRLLTQYIESIKALNEKKNEILDQSVKELDAALISLDNAIKRYAPNSGEVELYGTVGVTSDITLNNAPAGTTASVKSRGGVAKLTTAELGAL